MGPPPYRRSDPLHEAVGDFGRWQAGLSVIMALLKMPIAWFQLSILILEAPMDYWCAQPELAANLSLSQWRELSQLDNKTGRYDACLVRPVLVSGQGNLSTTGGSVACDHWEFDRGTFLETIVSEWNLVCGSAHLTDIAQATFMFGVLLGNVAFGAAADRFGRKTPLMVAIALQAACGMASAFTPWYLLFLVSRLLLAVATGGTMIISFVLIMELVGDSWRTTVSILYQLPFSLGVSFMAGVAFLQRDWRHFQFTLSAVSALFLVYWCLIPESPRWLLAVGRDADAVRVLERAARWNRRDVSEVKKAVERRRAEGDQETAAKASLADLMRTPNLRGNALCLCFIWFVEGLGFFGISQIMGHVGSNIFITVTVAGLIGLPGTFLSMYAVKFGRKKAIITSQMIAAVCCLLVLAVPKGYFAGDWPRVALVAVALTSLSLTFPAVYLLTGEILPTVVRNLGLGLCSMSSRVGSMLAPFVKSLGARAEFLPMLVIGVMLVIGSALLFALPETMGRQLPDSLEDGRNYGRRTYEDKKNANYIQIPQQPPKET